METKYLSLNDCALKFAGVEGKFSGYGSVFGVLDSHKDIIMPGAFAEVIKSGDPVHAYVNHGWMRGELPVGKYDTLSEDHVGLKGDASLQMGMPSAINAYWAMKGDLVSGLSIGFLPDPNGTERRADGTRVIHRIKRLKEISIVTDPSNGQARVAEVKSVDLLDAIDEVKTIRDLEALLRDAAGLSKRAAQAFTTRAKTLSGVRDAHDADEAEQAVLARLERLGSLLP